MACILRSLRHIKHFSSLSGKFLNYRVPEHFNLNIRTSQHIFLSQRYIKTNLAIAPTKDENEIDNMVSRLDLRIQRYGNIRSYDLQQVIQLMENKGYIESIQALILIRACGNFLLELTPKERMEFVDEVWNDIQAYNTPIDVSHYNALLVVYNENLHNFSSLDFLSNMKNKNISPNKVTYERLLKNSCRHGDLNTITKIVELMKQEGVPLTESTFNSFITGYSQADDIDNAVHVLDLMKESKIEPSAETYTELMCVYAKGDHFGKIQEILSECKMKDIPFSNRQICEVILTLCMNKHQDHANEMIPLLTIPKAYPAEEIAAIAKMIENNQEKMAVKLFEHLELFNRNSCNSILIRKLMSKVEASEDIVEICRNMEKTKLFPNVTLTALEVCLRKDNQSLVWSMMDLCQEQNYELRVHYFWPILLSKARSYDYQGVLNVLKRMITKYGIRPNAETLATYVLPYTTNALMVDIEKLLVDCEVSFSTIHHAMMMYMLNEGKLRQALKYMKRNPIEYRNHIIADSLNVGFSKTRDIESLVQILLVMEKSHSQKYVVGSFPFNDLRVLPDMLKYMEHKEYYITEALANDLKMTLGEKCDPDLRKSLDNLILTKNNMTPRADSSVSTSGWMQEMPRDPKDIIQKINLRCSQGFSTDRLKIELLVSYIKEYNLEKVNESLERLRKENIELTEGNYANLIDLYCTTGMLNLAENYLREMRQKYPDAELDYRKSIIYATALAENDRITEAIEVLNKIPSKQYLGNRKYKFLTDQRICIDLLNVFVNKDDEMNLQQFFKTLVGNNYLQVSNLATAPFVRIHLQKNNIEAALQKFLWAFNTYNLLPMRRELLTTFIRLEDSKSLQTVIDCCMKILGQGQALIILVMHLLECDRIEQAKKVLQTSQLSFPVDTWDQILLRFHDVEVLEHLIEIGSNIPSINRLVLYKRLLILYDINDEWEKGLNLWVTMQENNVSPDEEFLSILRNMLVNNNQTVPFVSSELKATVKNPKSLPEKLMNMLQFRKYNYAFRVLKNIKSYTEDLNPVYEQLINHNLRMRNIVEAKEIVKHGLSWNPKLSENPTFKKVLGMMERKKDDITTSTVTNQQ